MKLAPKKYIPDKYRIEPPTSKKRWIDLYNDMDVDENYWQLIYETPFQITKNVKVLMVQYKIINRILAVNHNLKKWKRIEISTCELFNNEDTIEHFLYECEYTQQLWKSILKNGGMQPSNSLYQFLSWK